MQSKFNFCTLYAEVFTETRCILPDNYRASDKAAVVQEISYQFTFGATDPSHPMAGVRCYIVRGWLHGFESEALASALERIADEYEASQVVLEQDFCTL